MPLRARIAGVMLVLCTCILHAQNANWEDLNTQAVDLARDGKFPEAIEIEKEAAKAAEAAFGPNDARLATALDNLAQFAYENGQLQDAEPLYRRALSIRQKAFGPESPEAASVINHIGELYHEEKKYSEADASYNQALHILEKVLGQDDPKVALVLNNLAQLYDEQGRYAEAEPLFKRTLAVDEKVLAPDDPGLATDLDNLGAFYVHQARYADAEAIFLRVIRVREKILGPDHPDLATSLSNLALLYSDEGQYGRAEPLLNRALRIDKKALGPTHAHLAVDLTNLGETYRAEGNLPAADPLLRQALSILEHEYGSNHPTVATAANNLAELCDAAGQRAEAETLYRRALDIDQKALDPGDPEIAEVTANLASLFFEAGKYNESEPLYQQALKIEKQVHGPEHPAVATLLNNLALLKSRQGDYPQSESLYQQALRIDEKTLDPDHPNLERDLQNVAALYFDQGNQAQAEPYFKRALQNVQHQFQYNFTYMSEKERLAFLDTVADVFPTYFSFVDRFHATDPALIGSMYNVLLWQKGFVVSSIASMRRQIEATGDKQSLELLHQLASSRAQLTALLQAAPREDAQGQKLLDEIRSNANSIEKTLAERSSAYAARKANESVTWEQVRNALRPDEAAVEFARFRVRAAGANEKYRYAALVVSPETKSQPVYISLGDESVFHSDALVQLQRSVQSRGTATDVETVPGAAAYDLIWKPIASSVQGKKRLYISLDGELNAIAIGVIAAPDGKLLMEDYDLRILSSTKEILREPVRSSVQSAVLVGDPSFDLGEPEQEAALRKLESQVQPRVAPSESESDGDLSRDLTAGIQSLARLPGTGAEVSAIADLMQQNGWKAAVYTRDLALKRVVQQAQGQRVLHIATHGFFLPDQQIDSRQPALNRGDATAGFEEPMLRSGLYFAGANRALNGQPSDADNGILTALEAASLDLSKTELVVLSACNTGQGELKNGEGIFGLRRALQEAGAQSVLMSLWSVPDKETLELMRIFYKKWLSGTEKHEALKEAQLEVREQVKREHDGRDLPYYWGAFILVGN